MNTRVLVVDDHNIVREGFCALLQQQPDLEVIGQAENGRAALEMTREFFPHLILLDISMPDMNGIEAAHKIREEFPDIKIIILTMHLNKQYVERALRAGVRGYLLKNAPSEELLNAIKTVMQGGVYLTPKITDVVVEEFIQLKESESKPAGKLDTLSPREREVLQLIAEGLTSKEIADRLNVGSKTIDSHRQRIMEKTRCPQCCSVGKIRYTRRLDRF
jgi:DNA-binding NarL/FixJ family response regulator